MMIKRLGKLSVTFFIPALIILITGCSGGNNNETSGVDRTISVKGELVTATSKSLTRSFTGTLEGEQQAVIRAKINEAVERIHFPEGERVKANTVLVSLDKSGPSSRFIQANSLFRNAEKNFHKMEYLYSEGAVSESQFDVAKTEYEVARADFEAASKLVELRTPIGGTVTAINVSVGDYVYTGQQVATVAVIDKLRMKLGVNASDVEFFNIGDKVVVHVGSRDIIAGGKVVTVAGSADPDTRTFQVEIEIDNSNRQFKPGMFARSEIIIAEYENVVVAPRVAILDRNNRTYVFVARGDRAVLNEVTLGVDFNGYAQITDGLQVGDTVITVGQSYLEDSTKINLVRFVDADGKEVEL